MPEDPACRPALHKVLASNMGHHTQNSALDGPDLANINSHGWWNFVARQVSKRKTRRGINDTIEETRLIALLMAVPPEKFCTDTSFCKRWREVDKIWFGQNVNHRKVANTFKYYGKYVLRSGYTTTKELPNEAACLGEKDRQDFVALSNHEYIPTAILKFLIHQQYPCIAKLYPQVRTWYEMRLVAASLGLWHVWGNPLETMLKIWQTNCSIPSLGLLRNGRWRLRERIALQLKLRFRQASKLVVNHNDFALKNHFLVVGLPKSSASVYSDCAASVAYGTIVRLHSTYFTYKYAVFKEIPLNLGKTLGSRTFAETKSFVMMHEATHLGAGISATDESVDYYSAKNYPFKDSEQAEGAIEAGEGLHMGRRKVFRRAVCKRLKAYHVPICLELIKRDEKHNTRTAEDNASNWENCMALKVCELVYPDWDFPLHVKGKDAPKIRRRTQLRHHNTLFHFMRHAEAPQIDDGTDYDPEKDPWGPKSGRQRPKTVKQLIEILLSILKEDGDGGFSSIPELERTDHSYYVDLRENHDKEPHELRDGDIPALFMLAGRHRTMRSAMPNPYKGTQRSVGGFLSNIKEDA